MHYTSLQDYVTVLRRYRLLILLAVVVVAGAALANAMSKPDRYRASTVLSYRDLSEDLAYFGIDANSSQPLSIRNAANAQRATGQRVARRVQRNLSAEFPVGAIRGSVSAQVNTAQLVVLTAQWGGPEMAAEIANEFARQIQQLEQKETRRRLEAVRESLIDELAIATEDDSTRSGIQASVLEGQLARVQTLLDVADPVVIVERASVPAAPFTPNPVRDGIIGALVGLLIGITIAFTRVALDRRLRTAYEVHAELDVPVLGRVPRSAMGKAGLAVNGSGRIDDADFEAFRLLRTKLGFLSPEKPIRSILCTSAVAGEGKSTVSMSLASAAALAGQDVLLAECDLRRPVFAKRLGVEPTPGLSDYLSGRAEPQAIVQTVELAEPGLPADGGPDDAALPALGERGQLFGISAGTPIANPAELLLSDRFGEFMSNVTQAYDLVLLDTPPLLAVVDALQLIPRVDAILLCVKADETTRDQLRAAHAALEHIPERPTAAVITGLRRDGSDTYEYYYGY